jgi:hypothetical protein
MKDSEETVLQRRWYDAALYCDLMGFNHPKGAYSWDLHGD